MTNHPRNGRKRRTLTRTERIAVVALLREAPYLTGFDLTRSEFFALASELEGATIIVEVPAKRRVS